jgi:hypothetical protein
MQAECAIDPRLHLVTNRTITLKSMYVFTGYVSFAGSFICGNSQNRLICGHMLKKNRFTGFHLRAYNEIFDYLAEQWLGMKKFLLSSGATTK